MNIWNIVRRIFRCIIKTLFTIWLLMFGLALVTASYEVAGLPGLLIVICVIGTGVVRRMRKDPDGMPARPAPLPHDSAAPTLDLAASHSLTLSNGD